MKRKSYTDALTTLAKGTDAGLYRLIPERVEIVNSEEEVQEILAECRVIGKPLTFKAGGTSLSGQTITDSVLVEIGPDFGKIKISEDGTVGYFSLRDYRRSCQPAVETLREEVGTEPGFHQIGPYQWDRGQQCQWFKLWYYL